MWPINRALRRFFFWYLQPSSKAAVKQFKDDKWRLFEAEMYTDISAIAEKLEKHAKKRHLFEAIARFKLRVKQDIKDVWSGKIGKEEVLYINAWNEKQHKKFIVLGSQLGVDLDDNLEEHILRDSRFRRL